MFAVYIEVLHGYSAFQPQAPYSATSIMRCILLSISIYIILANISALEIPIRPEETGRMTDEIIFLLVLMIIVFLGILLHLLTRAVTLIKKRRNRFYGIQNFLF
jgi:hypothetical protein